MDIKNLLRKIISIMDTPNQPNKPKKSSPFWDGIKRAVVTAFNALFIGILVSWFFLWIYVLAIYTNGYFLPLLGQDGTATFVFFTPFLLLSIVGWILQENPEFVNRIYIIGRNKVITTYPHKIFSSWIYKVSKAFFDKLILPNIDLFEPGLTGQTTEGFPDLIVYSDDNNKKPDHIYSVNQKLIFIVVIAYCVFLVFFCVSSILFATLLPEVINNILSQIMLLVLFISIPSFFILLFHPDSLIAKRRQVLLKEFRRLSEEEWLQESIKQIVGDSGRIIEDYSTRLKEMRFALHQETIKLSELQMDALISKENIDAMENFISTNPKAALLMFDSQERLQEKREKKVRWKNWLIDIVIGIISALIFKLLFG